MSEDAAYPANIRRSILKVVLSGIERLPEDVRKGVLSSVPPEVVETTHEGLSIDWVSAHDYHMLINPVYKHLGPEGFRKFYTAVYVQLAELPILGAITHTALRLGASTPLGLAKYAPPAWKLLSKGMGRLELTHPVLELQELRCVGYPTYLGPPDLFAHAFAGTFDGFYVLCRQRGRVEMVDFDAKHGNVVFVFAGN